MRNRSLALVTVIALCINGVAAGLAPLPAAATAPDRNPAALGALPAWFAATPDGPYPAASRETSADDPLSTGIRLAPANGRGGGTRHRYFVPFNDEHLWRLFDEKNTGLPGAQQCHVHDVDVAGSLNSSIFLIASSDRTRYYYDHWEDGYDADPLDPEQRSDTTVVGMLDAGAFEVFQSAINPGQVGTEFFYDGRDLITVVGEQAAVVRQVYPSTPGTVLAAAWEIPDIGDWGTAYVATVGEDLVSNPGGVIQDHDFTGLEVMAAQDGTVVYRNGELLATLDTGETHPIYGANDGAGGEGVDSTDTITATGPIQVQMMTGSCGGARYSAHGYTLQPVDVWDTVYWAPVPGFEEGCGPSGLDADTDVYLHNPHSDAIVVAMSGSVGTYDIPIPAGSTVSVLNVTGLDDISAGTGGTQFYSSQPFWGVGVIDSATNGDSEGRNFDWGYSLIPESRLSSHVIIGYAPGNGADPPTDNGNLAFVTALTDTVVYVDLNQDGLPDPFDMNGDGDRDDENVWGVPEWDEPLSALGVPLAAYQVLRVGDPDDHDLTGALIYTPDLEQKIAAAWGQDPCWADYGRPYLDLGYTVLPTSVPRLSKADELAIDADLSGGVSPGDTITYTLVLHNNGTGVMHNVVLTDPLPYTYVDYVVGSLGVTEPPTVGAKEYSNDGVNFAEEFENPDIQALRVRWPSIGPGRMVTITFRVQIRTDIPPDIMEISNQAVVGSDDTDPRPSQDPDDPDDPDTDTPVGRPLLSIDKRVSPPTVRPGDRVTYTLVVSNYGNGVALLTVITDVLPSWATYVSRTLDLTWPIAQEVITTHIVTYTSSFHGTYADDFDLSVTQATDYAGNDGSLTWSTDWTEVNDDVPGDPGSGEVQVRMDGNGLSEPAHLWMEDADGDDAGVERTMDLSEFVIPTLRYYVSGNTDLDGNDFYRVEIDGISELQEQYSGGYTIQEIDLSTAAGDPAVTLGLLASGGTEAGEYYRFDHISVSESDPFRIMTRTVTEESTVLSYVTRTGGDPASYDEVTGYMVITEGMRLPAGGFITATFQAQVAKPLTDGLKLRNTACTTASNWINIPEDDARCDDAEIEVQADHTLSITKAAAPSPVAAGNLLTYTLTYTITGDEAVESALVSDTTPANTTFYAATPTPISDPGVRNSGPVIWQVDGLWPPGSGITQAAGSLTMVVRVDSSLVSDTTICNTVVITDTGGLTDTDEICTPAVIEPGLELIKTVDPDRTVPDMPFTYTLRIVNTGSYTFTALRLTDNLPADFWYVDGSGRPVDPDVIAEPLLVWSDLVPIVGPLAPGESLDVSFQVTTPLTDGTYTNTATVEGVYPGGTLTDTDDAPISIADPAVAIDKRIASIDDDEVEPNYVTFTITIDNIGPSTIDVLPLLDEYESYTLTFEYSEPYADAVSEVADDGLLTWDDLTGPAPNGFDRNLPPGHTFVVTTVFLIIGTGTTTNTAIVTGATDVYGNPADPVEDDEIVGNTNPALTVLYFRALAEESAVRLEWATAAEVGIDTFHVYRASDKDFDLAELIARVDATGRGSTYRYVDRDVTMNEVYWYWLAEVNTDDEGRLHGPVWGGVGPSALPMRLYLPLVRRD
jgi:uncharacterized repeat protein (TIGR01451 family)